MGQVDRMPHFAMHSGGYQPRLFLLRTQLALANEAPQAKVRPNPSIENGRRQRENHPEQPSPRVGVKNLVTIGSRDRQHGKDLRQPDQPDQGIDLSSPRPPLSGKRVDRQPKYRDGG